METDVNFICNLDPNIYKVITTSIVTTQVIITDRQLEHIRERHPDISETVIEQLEKIISSPDYIIETDMPSTACKYSEAFRNQWKRIPTHS